MRSVRYNMVEIRFRVWLVGVYIFIRLTWMKSWELICMLLVEIHCRQELRLIKVSLSILLLYRKKFTSRKRLLIQFYPISILGWKSVFLHPKLVFFCLQDASLSVCKMFNQISPKWIIMFLCVPFALLFIHIFPV